MKSNHTLPSYKKSEVTDLATFGGSPLFPNMLHVGRPNLGNRETFNKRIDGIFERNWLTNRGPLVLELEEKLASYLQVKHCILVCNATVALEITARALDMKGEVIVPSFTFVATPHSLQWQEITPVFCDIKPGSHNIDPMEIEKHITPKTTGIVGVHVWGQACDVEAINHVAKKHSLSVLYDAAHAFGCSYQGKMIGGFGDAEVFSFHATKFYNTFEGGAVTTNSDQLAHKIRLMQNFGFEKIDTVTYIGTNGKMSEVSAAMGLTGLEQLDTFIDVNRQNYQAYQDGLSNLDGVRMIHYNETERNNYQYIVLEIDEAIAGISRDKIAELLHVENIRARRYFYPACHKMEPYKSYFPHAGLLLPHTEQLVTQVMTLPTGTAVSPADVIKICDLLRFVIVNGTEINARISANE